MVVSPKMKKKLLLNKILYKRKTFIITTSKNVSKIKFFKRKGFKFIYVNSLKTKNDFNLMLKKIYKLGYCRAFFETGLTFLNSLLNYNLLNNLYVFQNDKKLVKNGLNNDHIKYLKKIKLENKIKVNLNNDSLFKINF